MSTTEPTATPAATPPEGAAEPTPAATEPATTPPPPWGSDDEFKPDVAWKRITEQSKTIANLKAKAMTPDAEAKLAEFDRLRAASQTELEKAQEAASKATERIGAITTRAVQAEVKALAAGFADPSDASAFLDMSKYANDSGEIDTEAIAADLAELLTAKPHLAAKDDAKRVPAPNPAQGAGGSAPVAVSQLTEQEVKQMYADKKYGEIEKARQEGRLNTLLGA